MFRFFIFKSAISLVLLMPNKSLGQQLLYHFQQFNANDGLPSSEVHQVLRDSRNFMWFATDHGVCRYDGYNFETFDLPFNSILSLYEDSKKRIWAASFSGQLFFYENGKFYDYKYNDLVARATDQIPINRIYVDSLDNVFVSTTAPDCFVINNKGEINNLFGYDKNIHIEAFETDINKYFTYIGRYILSKGSSHFPGIDVASFVSVKSKAGLYNFKFNKSIQGIKCGVKSLRDGSLLFYSGNYLFRINSKGIYNEKEFESNILDINEIDNDEFLVATIQKGLFVLDKRLNRIQNYFQGLTVTAIEKDYEGGIWISTTQSGVFYLNSLKMKHLSRGETILNDKILCLESDGHSGIWAGDEGNTLLHLDNKKKLFNYEFSIVSIKAISEKTDSRQVFICVGDFLKERQSKLRIFKKNNYSFIFLQGISNVLAIKNGFIAGKVGGIINIVLKKHKAEFINKKFFRVSSLFKDHSNNLLVGNVLGLWKFVNDELIPYDKSNPLFSVRTTDINEYKGKCLLLGTRGKGLLLVFKDTVYQIEAKDGITSNNIRKIFVDENIIWLATNRGISRMTIESLIPFKYDIQNISVEDGLLSNEVNDIKRLDSNIVVATNKGISFFSRNLYAQKSELPVPIYITAVKINNLDTTIAEKYKLNRSGRNFSVSFVGLSFRKKSTIEYRYRLLGIDSNWINTTATQVQFNPIPYGNYIVQIEARRQGEKWRDSNMVSLSIICKIPFWKTVWFGITAFLLPAFLMFLFFINRTKNIILRERERTELNKKIADMELKALRAQMNPHFIFNVLNSIQYFIMHNESEAAQTYLSKFAKLVRLTLDNSRSTFISLADELSLLKLYIDLEKIRFEDRFDYQIDIGEDVAINSIQIPNMLLQPYVENSIKHGFKNKQTKYFLIVSVSNQNKKISCTITDNGIGRDNAALLSSAELDKHASTGTVIVKEKIEALKFYYNYDMSSHTEDLKDKIGNAIGTRVTLTFPENLT